MSRILPAPPPEPTRVATLDECAPLFAAAVRQVLVEMQVQGHKVRIFETMRSADRQEWLYGMGRDYDDGRGRVTNARASSGWHTYGLAADLVEDDATPWRATTQFWRALGAAAEKHGLVWGGRWKALDLPHVQWGRCRRSPSARAGQLVQDGGLIALWREVGAA